MAHTVDLPTRVTRLDTLTGLRFFAALSVFVCHSYVEIVTDGSGHVPGVIYAAGWFGVGFFFILSGFVLAWSGRRDDPVRGFWRRRLVKVYPNHLVTWFAAILLALYVGEGVSARETIPSLFLLHAFWPDLQVVTSVNVPSWSLSVELLFYLSFPWLFRMVARIPGRRLLATAVAVVVAVAGVAMLASVVFAGPVQMQDIEVTETQNWFVYAFPVSRMLDFLLGIVVARIVTERRLPVIRLRYAFGLLLVGVVVQASMPPTVFAMVLPVIVPLALVVAAGAFTDVNGTRSIFRHPLVVRLGEISFAFYLVHFLVLHYGHVLLGPGSMAGPVRGIGVSVLFFAVTLCLSWLLHRFVEVPMVLNWSRSRRERIERTAGTARKPAPGGLPPAPWPGESERDTDR